MSASPVPLAQLRRGESAVIMGREALVSPSLTNQRSRTRGQGSTSAGPPLFCSWGQRFGRPGGVSLVKTFRFFSM